VRRRPNDETAVPRSNERQVEKKKRGREGGGDGGRGIKKGTINDNSSDGTSAQKC
jgi:hypothetical protein